jgi:hypothetical protein
MISYATDLAKANFLILFSVFTFLKTRILVDTVIIFCFLQENLFNLKYTLVLYFIKCVILKFK